MEWEKSTNLVGDTVSEQTADGPIPQHSALWINTSVETISAINANRQRAYSFFMKPGYILAQGSYDRLDDLKSCISHDASFY